MAISVFSLDALLFGDSVFDKWYQTVKVIHLLAQIFNYVFMLVAILVIMNVFLIIIGDGYVKSKYYHKNHWVKSITDKTKSKFGIPLAISDSPEGEDPFKPFVEFNEKEDKSRKILIKMLMKDKEIILNEFINEKIKRQNSTKPSNYKTEEEIAEEELQSRSMETHTRKIIKLIQEIKANFQRNMEEYPWKKEILKAQLQQSIQDITDLIEKNKPLEDKSFYF